MQPQPVRRRIFFNEFFARGCLFKLERWKQPQVRYVDRHGSGSLATWAAIRRFTDLHVGCRRGAPGRASGGVNFSRSERAC